MLLFSEKVLNEKNIQNLISHKEGYIHFRHRTPFPSKDTWAPETVVWPFSQKIQPFLKKLLNNKVFCTSFVIKKIILIFGARRLLSLKNS